MKSFSSAILAKLILDYRKDSKVSQEALATESGINRSVLSKIEQAEHVPSITQLEALANIIGFDITELFAVKKEKTQKYNNHYYYAIDIVL